MKRTLVLLSCGLLMAAALFAADIVHVVKKGETLTAISHQYHVPVADILKHNGLKGTAGIKAGQKLKIPSKTAAPAAKPKPAPAAKPAAALPETAALAPATEKLDTIMPEAAAEKPDTLAPPPEQARKPSKMSVKTKFFILVVVQTLISALLSYLIAVWVVNRNGGYKRGA